MEIFEHSYRRAFVRSHTDVGREDLTHSLCSNSKGSVDLRSGLRAAQSSSSTPTWTCFCAHCFWVNLKTAWFLEVCSDWLYRRSVASAHYARYMHVTCTLHGLPIYSVIIPLGADCRVLSTEELVVSVRWRYHTVIHWAPQSSSFFHKCLQNLPECLGAWSDWKT